MTTKQTIRRGAALGVFAASIATVLLAGGMTPRTAEGHSVPASEPATTDLSSLHHFGHSNMIRNLRVEVVGEPAYRPPGESHDPRQVGYTQIRVSWDAPHHHFPLHWTLESIGRRLYSPTLERVAEIRRPALIGTEAITGFEIHSNSAPSFGDLLKSTRAPRRAGESYSEVFSSVRLLSPGESYTVFVAPRIRTSHRRLREDGSFGPEHNVSEGGEWYWSAVSATVTVPISPGEPETPTPPEPETPAQTCTYEHRMTGVPASTGGGYTSQILITSKDSKATVTLRAFQAFNGAPIDVLDSTGSAVGATTSLSPANSLKVFRLEGAQGWHTVIVSHPTARAMRRATVAMRLREPDVGVNIIPAQGIEDCTPAVTTVE